MRMSTQTSQNSKLPPSPLVDAALARTLPGISPAGLLEAIENADAITGTARGFLYIQLHTLQQLANSHTFTVSHRLQYATLLAKIGKVIGADVVDGAAAQAPNVNIVFESPTEPRPTQTRPVLSVVPHEIPPKEPSAGDTQDTLDFLPDFSDIGSF
jgi:hypothetical protein